MNAELAEICGIHAGDGYLRNSPGSELDISGNVQEKEYYDNHVIPLFSDYFDIDITPKFFKGRNTYGFVIRDRKIVEEMHKMGFPYGAKSLIVRVPKAILIADEGAKTSFLRGLFDTDGCLTFDKRYKGKYRKFKLTYHYYPRIMLGTVSKPLFEGIKTLLEELEFGFKTYLYKGTGKCNDCHRVWIYGNTNLERWINEIGPKNNMKRLRYDIWKEHGFCPPNLTLQDMKDIINKHKSPIKFYGPVA